MEMPEKLFELDFNKLKERVDKLDQELSPAATGFDRHVDNGRIWQDTFDFIADLLFVVDRHFTIIRANKAVHDFFPNQTVLGKKCFDIFHNSSQPISNCPGCKVFHSGKSGCMQTEECHFADSWFEVSVHPIKDSHGFVWQSLHICKDISRLKELEQRLSDLEVKDGLTSLYNRRIFNNILTREFELAAIRRSDLSLLVMELDELKVINQDCGQQFGDYILQEFGHQLRNQLGPAPLCARLAGEQFAVLLPEVNLAEAQKLAREIHQLAENHIYDDFFCRQVTVTIGVASLFEHSPVSQDEFLCFAENALRFAKRAGRNRVGIYNLEDFI
jgi:diguanylate cyclase (GGDEF)-like protein/PAS domain S-box-containing protein